MPELPTAVGMGVVILLVAVAIPAAITTVETDQTATYDLDTGDRETVTQQLRLMVEETTQTTATVRLRDAETTHEETQTIGESNTSSYSLNGETVNVTLLEAEGSNQNATVSVSYSRTYGWDSGAKTMIANLPLVLAMLGFVVIAGSVAAVTRGL